MRGSIQIAKIFGIPVQLHWSFGLIFVAVVYFGFEENMDWAAIGFRELVMLALFFCVLLHEFGHALTARHFGVRTRDIILLPIGGVARLERLPEKPIQEFYVAIAGPLVNVGIIALLSPFFLLVSEDSIQQIQSMIRAYFGIHDNIFPKEIPPLDLFLFTIVALNGTLAVFNMLPAFPMDGGRVLRALLAMRLERATATRIAVYIGQFLAVLLVLYGIFGMDRINPMVIFIGIFVFVTAAQEYRMVRVEKMLDQHRVADVLRVNFTRFQANDRMQLPATELNRGLEKNFLVFDENQQVQGILQEADILKALKTQALEQPVENFIHTDYESIQQEDSLKTVFAKMQWQDYDICPVKDEAGNLLGVIDSSALNTFMRQ